MTNYKSFVPEFKAADDDGSASWVMATMHQVDSDGDVTLPGFFGKQNVVVLPAHDRSHVPLGKGTIREEDGEAIADVKFNLDIPAARDWHSAIKFDLESPPSLQEFSYGFSILEGGATFGDFKGQRVRFLQPKDDGSPGVDVHETSPVVRGAGVNTRTLTVKGEGLKFSEHAKSVLTDVSVLIDRLPEVIAFRAEQGKSRLSEHSVEMLDLFEAELKRLVALRDAAPPDTSDDDIAREYARFVALTQGVTT